MPPPPDKKSPLLGDLSVVWQSRRQLWRLVPRPDKFGFASGMLIMAVVAVLESQVAIRLGALLNGVKSGDLNGSALWNFVSRALIILAVLYVSKESLQLIRRWMLSRTTTRIEANMMVRLVGHLLKTDLGAMARERVGSLHGRISRSVEGYVKFLKVVFTDFLPALLTAAVALYYGLTTNWKVGLLMVLVVPVSLLITVWQVSSQKGIRQSLLGAKEGLDGTVVEQLGGLEYIRAANTYATEVGRIEAATEARRVRELKHGLAMMRFDWAKSMNEGLFHVAIIGFGIVMASRGEFEYGTVLTFSMLYLNISRPLKEVHRILEETYNSSQQVTVLLGMLNQPVDRSFEVATLRPPVLDGTIPLLECRDLVVNYTTPDGSPRRILNGLSLEIRQGETIGIAGRSGSGKSTWLRCMLRLIHPESGEVLVGGVPIGVLSRADIGKSIGYVSQVPFVFSGTVTENISYGCGTPTRQQIEVAATQAHIHDEILEMPQGYDTPLTERGGNLSGGQRQRIALARMFLKNPPILILDEGTSALDNISERQVRAAIENARQSHTVIMVAHRLSTLNQTDRIFVFDEGQVVEQGGYDDLVAQDGVFAELVRSAEMG